MTPGQIESFDVSPVGGDLLAVADGSGRLQPWLIQADGQAMAWLDAEQRVLAALVDHAVSTGFDEHGWQLAITLATFFDRKGHADTSLKTLQAALAPAQRG